MPRPGVRNRPAPVTHSVAIENLANSLAEREYKGQIKLTPQVGKLVRAILTNKDAAGIAEELDRADTRGALHLSQEAAQLVEEVLVAKHGAQNVNRESAAMRESRGTEVLRGKGGRFAGRRRL